MKKKLLLLFPLLALGIVGCNKNKNAQPEGEETPTDSGDTTPSDDTPTFGEEVTTYLVLGEYGRYRGNEGIDVPDKFLENTIEYVAKIGDPLPKADEVTTTVSGSSFLCWQAYEGDIEPKSYDVVPAVRGKILYARFSGGDGGGGSGGEGDLMPIEGFGLIFSDQSFAVGQLTDEQDPDNPLRVQYKITQHEFKTGQSFQLYDFGNKGAWVEDLNPYSFGNTSGSGLFWPHYIQKGVYYTCLVDFTCDVYIKVAPNDNDIYFGDVLPSQKIDIEDVDLPTEGYGIMMSDKVTYATATATGGQDPQGRDEYKISAKSFTQGERFQLYDFAYKAGWVIDVNGFSFGGDSDSSTKWMEYLAKGNSYYTVLQDFEVDIYIQLKNNDDRIYFELTSGGGDSTPTPSNIYALVNDVQTAMIVHDEDEYKLTGSFNLGDTIVFHNGETAVGYDGIKAANNELIAVSERGANGEIVLTANLTTATFYFTYGATTEAIWGSVTPEGSVTTTLTYYFSAPADWGEIVYAYAYETEENKNAAWPGISMTYVKTNDYDQRVFSITFLASAGYTTIVFDNNNGKQTCDIPINGVATNTQFWIDGESYGSQPYAG